MDTLLFVVMGYAIVISIAFLGALDVISRTQGLREDFKHLEKMTTANTMALTLVADVLRGMHQEISHGLSVDEEGIEEAASKD